MNDTKQSPELICSYFICNVVLICYCQFPITELTHLKGDLVPQFGNKDINIYLLLSAFIYSSISLSSLKDILFFYIIDKTYYKCS